VCLPCWKGTRTPTFLPARFHSRSSASGAQRFAALRAVGFQKRAISPRSLPQRSPASASTRSTASARGSTPRDAASFGSSSRGSGGAGRVALHRLGDVEPAVLVIGDVEGADLAEPQGLVRASQEGPSVRRPPPMDVIGSDVRRRSPARAGDSPERAALPGASTGGVRRAGRTGESIDWAKWSWNPVTGCLHSLPLLLRARHIGAVLPAEVRSDLPAGPPRRTREHYGRTIEYPWQPKVVIEPPKMADYLKSKSSKEVEYGEGDPDK